VHIARKYNGEWMLAGGAVPFDLEGWVAAPGTRPYEGTLKRGPLTVSACVCSDAGSQLRSEAK
jgi:hypothetical protein